MKMVASKQCRQEVRLQALIGSCLVASIYAFHAQQPQALLSSLTASRSHAHTTTNLGMVAVDPKTITNKEYEDICGVSFDEQSLQQRLKSTKFLYPKHVEVIDEIAPMADQMVDDIVSTI